MTGAEKTFVGAREPTLPPEPLPERRREDVEEERKPLGVVWLDCSCSIVALGLEEQLRKVAHVHHGQKAPERGRPSLVLLCPSGEEDVASEVGRFQAMAPDVPVVILSLGADVGLARAAMRAGARGLVHAGMPPEQIARAISVIREDVVILPRELAEELVAEESGPDLSALSPRQLEILELVTEGLSNAQIAKALFLSESTVKQHLRGAYKVLRTKSRTQAAGIFRKKRPDMQQEIPGVMPRSVAK